ncbi:putative L,D-transpeptidase YnhG precursor [Halomonas chromatireducens]|uniref:Putative L,D-transpeptidase YnhG n=2 Tax=Halomonas chromatireducens TaxID=507626 RepID=A0A125R0F6_9GAMM|nr:putative L,D-transpeptidase YnhG precursor [Halomonas chromatireducens]
MKHNGSNSAWPSPFRPRPAVWATVLSLVLTGAMLMSAAALADEPDEEAASEWPKGHHPLPEAGDVIGENYTVEAREEETLLDIARDHNVGYEEIRLANPEVSVWLPGEGTEVVIPGRHILPAVAREGIVINIAELRLYYYPPVSEGETPRVETYPIGIGREGYDTPLGKTKTTMRLKDPAWYPPRSMREEAAERGEPAPAVVPPGPDNPLGRHAILLDIPGYLIHGTNDPDGIGMRASRGCIRMFPEDIETIFNRVPVGMQVNIINQPIKAGWDGDMPYVQVFETLEDQEYGMAALMETLSLLERNSDEPSVPLNYEQLRYLLENPNGAVVALEQAPEPEPAPESEPEAGGLYDELATL